MVMSRLGIELQTVFGMSPVDQVRLASALGCGHISTGLRPVPWQMEYFQPWSLREDADLRTELRRALQDGGVSISLGEGFPVKPGQEVAGYAAELDIFAELGTVAIGSICLEPDLNRALDQFDQLATLAAEREMAFNLEFAPPHPVNSLEKATALIKELGQDRAKLLLDIMHVFRSGATLDDIAALEPGCIGYVQLCDVPVVGTDENYYQEACFERCLPGEGELPLTGFLALIPSHIPVGIEVPTRRRANSRAELEQVIAEMVALARRMLNQAESTG